MKEDRYVGRQPGGLRDPAGALTSRMAAVPVAKQKTLARAALTEREPIRIDCAANVGDPPMKAELFLGCFHESGTLMGRRQHEVHKGHPARTGVKILHHR